MLMEIRLSFGTLGLVKLLWELGACASVCLASFVNLLGNFAELSKAN